MIAEAQVQGAVEPASKREASILRHMLGIDLPDIANPKPYRDYYCANPEDEQLHAMAAKGLVECYSTEGGYAWFRTTPAGRAAAFASHRSILRPKASRVYSRFLDVKDAVADLTFKKFITDPEFAEIRRTA